jgi:hypothetical protein
MVFINILIEKAINVTSLKDTVEIHLSDLIMRYFAVSSNIILLFYMGNVCFDELPDFLFRLIENIKPIF